MDIIFSWAFFYNKDKLIEFHLSFDMCFYKWEVELSNCSFKLFCRFLLTMWLQMCAGETPENQTQLASYLGFDYYCVSYLGKIISICWDSFISFKQWEKKKPHLFHLLWELNCCSCLSVQCLLYVGILSMTAFFASALWLLLATIYVSPYTKC